MAERFLGLAPEELDRPAIEITFEDDGVDVALAAYGRRVAQPLGNAFDGLREVTFGLGLRLELLKRLQGDGGEHRSGPRAKVLGRKFAAGDAPEVLIDVIGGDLLPVAIVIEVLEKLLAQKVLGLSDDFRDARIVQVDFVMLAGLALEPEAQPTVLHLHMLVAHGAEAKRAVFPRILLVAHAHERGLEQPHHGREDFFAAEAFAPDVACHLAADAREGPAEGDHAFVFVLVADDAPIGMVPVLLSPAGVASRRLDMTVGPRANPNLGPRRRDRQPLDPAKGGRIPHDLS